MKLIIENEMQEFKISDQKMKIELLEMKTKKAIYKNQKLQNLLNQVKEIQGSSQRRYQLKTSHGISFKQNREIPFQTLVSQIDNRQQDMSKSKMSLLNELDRKSDIVKKGEARQSKGIKVSQQTDYRSKQSSKSQADLNAKQNVKTLKQDNQFDFYQSSSSFEGEGAVDPVPK